MNRESTTIEMNIEQWRRDVQTFFTTTMQELEDITKKLYSGIAAPDCKPSADANENCDDRLANLKHRLSQRT